ncbi:hypothetical protein AB4Z50_24595 [Paenibacillus sp. 2TAB26]|uniref:hypothetical protein n=1 Tax=Paenibacillus sp. 2TAB26 TaxID=3233005 RepID=UPI003F9AAA78
MISDSFEPVTYNRSSSLVLNYHDESEVKMAYARLSKGSEIPGVLYERCGSYLGNSLYIFTK